MFVLHLFIFIYKIYYAISDFILDKRFGYKQPPLYLSPWMDMLFDK